MLSPGMMRLKESLACCEYNGAQHTDILVEEHDPAASLRKVRIIAPKGDWLSLNPDEGRKCSRIHKTAKGVVVMSPLLAIDRHDHHRACDSVVVVKRGEKLTIIYIDLKSGNPVGYSGQFKSTRQFVRYALGLLDEFHGEKLEVEQERYVILYGGKPALLNKRPTVPAAEGLGKSKPDEAYKRAVSNPATMYLKELLS